MNKFGRFYIGFQLYYPPNEIYLKTRHKKDFWEEVKTLEKKVKANEEKAKMF